MGETHSVRLKNGLTTSTIDTEIWAAERSASISSQSISITDFSEVKVAFDFKAKNVELGEKFFLESSPSGADGTWKIEAEYERNRGKAWRVQGSGTAYAKEATFPVSGSEIYLRFRCAADEGNDQIFVDNIVVSVFSTGTNPTLKSAGQTCDLDEECRSDTCRNGKFD